MFYPITTLCTLCLIVMKHEYLYILEQIKFLLLMCCSAFWFNWLVVIFMAHMSSVIWFNAIVYSGSKIKVFPSPCKPFFLGHQAELQETSLFKKHPVFVCKIIKPPNGHAMGNTDFVRHCGYYQLCDKVYWLTSWNIFWKSSGLHGNPYIIFCCGRLMKI